MIATLATLQEAQASSVDTAFFVGAILAASGVALGPLAMALLRRIVPRDKVFFARWGFSQAFVVVVAGLSAVVLAPLLGFDPTNVVHGLLATMLILGAGAGAAAAYAIKLHPEGLGALGFGAGRNLRSVVGGAAAYVVALPVLVGVGWMWPRVAGVIELDVEMQDVLAGILALEGGTLVFAIVVAVVVGPFLEELLFRGFLQPLLVQNLHETGGIVLTSFLFALLHGTAFLPIFALSLVLGAVQLRTHRLVASWAVHGLHNGLVLLLAFAWPAWRDTI